MSRPGMAPMYVRRWPRSSDSSCMPPRLTRSNARPVARATDWPSDVLPTPGGPTRHRIGALRLRVQLEHRQVLEDALLDLLQAEVVGVEHLLGGRQVDRAVGRLLPRQFEDSSR